MATHLASDADLAAPIRCLLSDVDGVMTDGRIIYDSAGVETKQFHVRDGLGVKVWMRCGLAFGIVSARNSPMVMARSKELGVEHILQGFEDKLPAVIQLLDRLQIEPSSVCYIGDDLQDIPVMRYVGLAVAPADAAVDARIAARWVLNSNGGMGTLRELIERLLRAKQRWEEHVPR